MTIISKPSRAHVLSTPNPSYAAQIEGVQYNYSNGEHELVVTLRGAEGQHAAAVSQGEAGFALVDESPLLVLCARFGDDLPWMAAPYCWHRTPSRERVLPPTAGSEDESRIQLEILLIEAADGSVRATRCVTLGLDFTRALNEAIREQARFPFDPREHDRRLLDLKRRCPTPEAMVAYATARTFGLP